jgi:hypothetical protein
MATRLPALSFGLALAAAIWLLAWPVYSGFHDQQPFRATLLEVNGPGAILAVMFPVLIAFLPLLIRGQAVRVVAAFLIGGFSLIAMSIGLFYLPAGIVMALAACLTDGVESRDARP